MKTLGWLFIFIGVVGLFFMITMMNTETYKFSNGIFQHFGIIYQDWKTLENTILFISICTLLVGIILLIVGSTEDTNEKSIRESITCSNCQSPNDRNANYCISCGNELRKQNDNEGSKIGFYKKIEYGALIIICVSIVILIGFILILDNI